ncbi:MAG: lysophospholipid acyltransferase family protein [Bacteroidales bacterium]|jgi:KDO2-lipid IV(A) lauroyltransferase|nr:lysophospholipid acyltransferase family protein [Bacteroidales bacterium]
MRFLFYFLLYPLSLLPLWVLYGIGRLFSFWAQYVIKYRKKVIIDNLTLSFPEKNKKEINQICRNYYRHFAHLFAEMLKMLTISRKELYQRYYCSNPELVNRFYEQGKSVILLSSHYNNWEWMVLSIAGQFRHHGIGIGKANSNKGFEKLINKARCRYGTEVVFAKGVRSTFAHYEQQHIPVAYMMLCDQSPNNIKKSYKTYFMHQPAGVIFGAEYFAKKYDIPVLYYEVVKVKRGYYRIDIELITETPTTTAYGEITEKYVQLLEQTIHKKPEYWLWSHRRWKRKVTDEDIEAQKQG